MQPTKVSQTGVGSTAWVPMDRNRSNFQVSIDCALTGTATYSVQGTLDDVLLVGSPMPNAFSIPNGDALSASALVPLGSPVSALRITITAGTGTVDATILQTGLRDG